jgi:hypothetical protein
MNLFPLPEKELEIAEDALDDAYKQIAKLEAELQALRSLDREGWIPVLKEARQFVRESGTGGAAARDLLATLDATLAAAPGDTK